MRTFFITGFIATVGILSLLCVTKGESTPALSSPLYVDGSLCTKPDKIIFSCPLAKSGKIVSICAAGIVAPHRFYYAFGGLHGIEMTYPSSSASPSNVFTHSYLGYSGGTGGYAYSFNNKEMKYIIYSVSGKHNFNAGGVIVQKVSEIRALADMKCAKGKIKEATDESLLKETFKWKKDDDINGHVLPSVN